MPDGTREKYPDKLGSVGGRGESYMRAGVGYKIWCLLTRGQD